MLIGDMAIKNLAPKDANSSGRIIKNMRICGSGLYKYHVSEAPLMGIEIPGDYTEDTFNVYRPAGVLITNRELYARVPIITGRHVRVDTHNAKELVCGIVGDIISYEVGDDGETYLYATGTIVTDDGIDAYKNLGQLSVGYDPIIKWEPGEHNNVPYQAKLTGFREINHLLICKTARGGPQCMVMDSLDGQPFEKIFNGGKTMGIFKKIFGGTKPISGDAAVVSALLQSISAGADPATQVAAVRNIMGDTKDDTLSGYLDELAGCKGEDQKVVAKAVDIVDKYYQDHFGDAEPPKPEPEKKEEPGDTKDATPEEVNKEESTGDAETKPEEEKKPCQCNGDSVSIDYEKLASLVAEKLRPAPTKQAGDEAATRELALAIGGDSKPESLSSQSVMDAIFK